MNLVYSSLSIFLLAADTYSNKVMRDPGQEFGLLDSPARWRQGPDKKKEFNRTQIFGYFSSPYWGIRALVIKTKVIIIIITAQKNFSH